MKYLLLVIALAGCAVIPASPESQILTGANGITAAATLGGVLLKREQITKAQASGYLGLLKTASGHLDTANATLIDCRSKTGSTAVSKPDPCAPSVMDDITLALTVADEVKRTLDAKGAQ